MEYKSLLDYPLDSARKDLLELTGEPHPLSILRQIGQQTLQRKREEPFTINDFFENDSPPSAFKLPSIFTPEFSRTMPLEWPRDSSTTIKGFEEEVEANAVLLNKRGVIQDKPFNAENSTRVSCTCSKSGCIKLYCDCYRQGSICGKKCRCINCKNQEKPLSKVLTTSTKPALRANACTCKKSSCKNNYCACKLANRACNVNCICEECINSQSKEQEKDPLVCYSNDISPAHSTHPNPIHRLSRLHTRDRPSPNPPRTIQIFRLEF